MNHQLPETGFLRLRQVLAFIPVARSTWLAGVKAKRYPQPTKALGARITVWRCEDIRKLIETVGSHDHGHSSARHGGAE